jgi:hypothetical protein
MSVITGIKGGVNPASNQTGVDTLKGLDRARADQMLTSLRDDLQEKTGVVRLLHTSSADRDLKFKNAGAFKQMFLAGDKLKRSGEVIEQLLRSAGLSEAKTKAFHAYVEKRGNSGVEAQQVLKYIDTLRAEVGWTPRDALEKFGVTLNQNDRAEGRKLGKGAQGEAVVVRYRGEDYVYKQAVKEGESLGSLDLTHNGPAGKQAKVAQQQARRSFEYFDPDEKSDVPNKGPTQLGGKQLQLQRQNSYQLSESPDDESQGGDSRYDNSPNPTFRNFLMGRMGLKAEDFPDFGNRFSRQSFNDEAPVATQKPQAPVQTHAQPLIIEEESSPQSLAAGLDLDQSIAQAQQLEPGQGAGAAQPSEPVSTTTLARTGLGVVARVKDLPQVITPSVYVIEESVPGEWARYHAVAGQQQLKDWARTQQPGSSFEVVGMLMPKAKGASPIEYPKARKDEDPDPPPRLNVARSDLKAMAQSSLELLKGLASHGFIHGDVKPENLVWDPKAKNLQLIDNDGLRKVSKAPGSEVEKGLSSFTLIYTSPVVWDPRYSAGKSAQAGLGRDLFSIGMVLLEASLMARGETDKANLLMGGLTFGGHTEEQAKYWMSIGKYEDGVEALKNESFPPGSVEAFARSCIIRSIEHEQARLDRQDFGFERYTAGNDQHLLAELERELAAA